MATIVATTVLAFLGKMTGDVATVLTGANIAFHAANAAVHWRKNGDPEGRPA
jgi:hypothetical protein